MALIDRKGSPYREKKERRKAQSKNLELGGTKMCNIMGTKKKADHKIIFFCHTFF